MTTKVHNTGPGLYEFLIEAELQQYYNSLKSELKIQSIAQLKYVTEADMAQIGMSKPEMRRLTKYFHKHCPQTVLGKMKKKLLAAHSREAAIPANYPSSEDTTTQACGMGLGGGGMAGGYGGGVRHASMAPAGPHQRHIIPADAIVVHKKLGSGEFGTVQQGVWTTSETGERIQVAIKCLTQERMQNNPIDFLKEASIMHSVEHESIVRLYGVVLDTAALMLVTELAPLRSLLEFIKEPSMRANASVPTLFDFAVQIADGMEYLESKRLIHRDLAARNILVFSKCKVKISDFGLSRALGIGKDYYQTNFNVNLKLPIAWCAPECINFLRFTSASDVWAFGVVLWELFSYGFQPWAGMTGQQILEAIDEPQYQRLERPECCPNEIYYQIMLKCWQHEPTARPTFAQLARNLLPECKPEQVQAIREFQVSAKSKSRCREQMLEYDTGEIITVLEKNPLQLQSASPSAGGSSQGSVTTSPEKEPHQLVWKGVLKCGKSGIFHPTNTVTYIGPTPSLPSVGKGPSTSTGTSSSSGSMFKRGSSLRRSRLSTDMISVPQGDLVHTGHVGANGQVFGDVAFIGGTKCWLPKQVVTPYKPETQAQAHQRAPAPTPMSEPVDGATASDTAPLLSNSSSSGGGSANTKAGGQAGSHSNTATTTSTRRRPPPLALHNLTTNRSLSVPAPVQTQSSDQDADFDPDHEYHEISDEENTNILDSGRGHGHKRGSSHGSLSLGITNPAEESQSPLDTPNTVITSFDPASPSPFEIDGDLPNSATVGTGSSLVDEVFGALERGRGSERERERYKKDKPRSSSVAAKGSSSSKKFGTVKPISASDRKTLDHAIALANELASKSMLDLASKKNSTDNLSFPATPNSPLGTSSSGIGASGGTGGSGILGGGGSGTGSKFSFILGGRQHSRDLVKRNYSQEAASIPDIQSSLTEEAKEAYNLLVQKTPTTPPTKSAGSSSKNMNVFRFPDIDPPKKPPHAQGEQTNYTQVYLKPDPGPVPSPAAAVATAAAEEEQDENPLRMLRGMSKTGNVLPLPPRDRKKVSQPDEHKQKSTVARHQRRYELVLPDLEPIKQSAAIAEPQAPPSISMSTAPVVPPPSTPDPPIVKKRPIAPPKPQRRISSGSESAGSSTFSPSGPGGSVHQRQASQLSQASTSSIDISNYMNFEEEPEPEVASSKKPQVEMKKADEREYERERTPASIYLPPLQPQQQETLTPPAANLNEIDDPFCTPAKVRIVKRILGASTSDDDAKWALRLTNGDGARAVKVLRLKALLPDSYFGGAADTTKAVSVLVDVHWDVARAAEFLLKLPSTPPTTHRKLSASDIANANANSNTGTNTGKGVDDSSYIRPTQV